VRFLPAGDEYSVNGGTPLPQETIDGIRRADVAIKGPVGETAADVIVKLRQLFDLYANIRPAKSYPGVEGLKEIDLVIARENTEDLYKGLEFDFDGGSAALRVITEKASRRIATTAAKLAMARRRKVTVVHKANVKKTCGLFARVATDELARFPELAVDEMYVDAAAMSLVRDPENFDVIVTTNMFGDILSDLAAQVAGGLGMAPSANLGESMAIFEPVHGSAPNLTGLNVANPYSMVFSVRMMLEWLGLKNGDEELKAAAAGLEQVARKALSSGVKTPDIGGKMGTDQVGRRLADIVRGKA
jgi:3-isopropylmalate dehydrogenase